MRKDIAALIVAVVLTLLANGIVQAQQKRGVYIWPATFYELGGISEVVDILTQNKITDVFLLVKGEDGDTLFPSEYSIRDYYGGMLSTTSKELERFNFMTDSTLLNTIIDKMHICKIRIHAWFIISGDRQYVKNHQVSEVVRIPRPAGSKYLLSETGKAHVNIEYPPYKKYMFSLIKEALRYPFDGLMLDKIRYTSVVYTWDEIHISKALRAGIDINKVIDSVCKSVYGNEDDKDLFINKYRDGDKDLREWVRIKKDDILDYVKEARKLTNEKGITLSTSFMPEGAYDEDFADVNYAQNYRELSDYLDYIVIMAYPKSFKQPATWLKMVTANAIEKSKCKIRTAIQGFDNTSPELVFDQVKNSRIANPDGIVVFRLGDMTSEMWTEFRKGMDCNLDSLISEQKKGIIYKGKGTIRNCWRKSNEALLKSDDIISFLYDETAMRDCNLYGDKSFLIIPGGGGAIEAEALDTIGLSNIEKFVSHGGGYIGICAGAYLPIKGYNNNLTEKLQLVNAEAIDIKHWNRGSGIVQLEKMEDHPVLSGIKDQSFSLNYFSGPILKPSNLKLPAYKELAKFKTDIHENGAKDGDMMEKTAILESRCKNGKIILFSPHPELTPGKENLLINAVKYVSRNE